MVRIGGHCLVRLHSEYWPGQLAVATVAARPVEEHEIGITPNSFGDGECFIRRCLAVPASDGLGIVRDHTSP